MNEAFRVYVLRNSGGRSYIGISKDVARRLHQHNSGESRWTRGKGPWTLSWHSEEMALTEARKLENRLKRQKGGNGLEYLINGRASSGS